METQTLATEVIKEAQERLENVVTELDCMDAGFDKALFAITEMMELIDVKPPETETDAFYLHECMKRLDSFAAIAFDYIDMLRSRISDVVVQERKNK